MPGSGLSVPRGNIGVGTDVTMTYHSFLRVLWDLRDDLICPAHLPGEGVDALWQLNAFPEPGSVVSRCGVLSDTTVSLLIREQEFHLMFHLELFLKEQQWRDFSFLM